MRKLRVVFGQPFFFGFQTFKTKRCFFLNDFLILRPVNEFNQGDKNGTSTD